MPQSRNVILQSAEQCFFRHGYTASSIAMISRYAEISRVTIHKQFSNKEALFKAVFTQRQAQMLARFPHYRATHHKAWNAIESMLNDWGQPIFEEITDPMVHQDLVQAAHRFCASEIGSYRQAITEFVANCLRDSVQLGEISLARAGLNEQEIASSLVLSVKGVFTTATKEDSRATLRQLLQIYRASLAA